MVEETSFAPSEADLSNLPIQPPAQVPGQHIFLQEEHHSFAPAHTSAYPAAEELESDTGAIQLSASMITKSPLVDEEEDLEADEAPQRLLPSQIEGAEEELRTCPHCNNIIKVKSLQFCIWCGKRL